tara:strand:- start:272 stop:511 length:240 start_codon:yes stop_codon:yes gene_type:complete
MVLALDKLVVMVDLVVVDRDHLRLLVLQLNHLNQAILQLMDLVRQVEPENMVMVVIRKQVAAAARAVLEHLKDQVAPVV